MIFPNIERRYQLHEHLEIYYVVDGYEAQLITDDIAGKVILKTKADTISNALIKMEIMLIGQNLNSIQGIT